MNPTRTQVWGSWGSSSDAPQGKPTTGCTHRSVGVEQSSTLPTRHNRLGATATTPEVPLAHCSHLAPGLRRQWQSTFMVQVGWEEEQTRPAAPLEHTVSSALAAPATGPSSPGQAGLGRWSLSLSRKKPRTEGPSWPGYLAAEGPAGASCCGEPGPQPPALPPPPCSTPSHLPCTLLGVGAHLAEALQPQVLALLLVESRSAATVPPQPRGTVGPSQTPFHTCPLVTPKDAGATTLGFLAPLVTVS